MTLTRPLTVLSLGAGVQSSTLALLLAKEHAIVDAAIFADTGAEPPAVYAWLGWLTDQLPFPVHVVQHGNLEEDTLGVKVSQKTGNTYWDNRLPMFAHKQDGTKGILWRKCTRDYKVLAIRRKARALMEAAGATSIQQLIGISRDEAVRMKDSDVGYIQNVYPLVDRDLTRDDCLRWMSDHGYPTPPRSACVFCPFHSNAEWLRLQTDDPESFARAVAFERRVAAAAAQSTTSEALGYYLHASCKPLDQIDFAYEVSERSRQMDLFANECEGMCGV